MKAKLWVIIGVLIIGSVMMVAPVLAATSGTTAITGNPAATVALTTVGSIADKILVPGTTVTDSTTSLTVNCNIPTGYTIEVTDVIAGKPAGSGGKMVETTDGTIYVDPNPKVLATAMSVNVPDDADYYTHASKTLSSAASSGFISSADAHHVVADKSITLTFSQPVSFADTVLSGGHKYRIVVQFDIAAKT